MPCAIRGQRNCGAWCFTICGNWVVWPPVAFTFLQKLMAAGWPQTPTALFADLAQILTWGEVNKCQTSRGRVNPIIGRWQSWSEPDNGWSHWPGHCLLWAGWVRHCFLDWAGHGLLVLRLGFGSLLHFNGNFQAGSCSGGQHLLLVFAKVPLFAQTHLLIIPNALVQCYLSNGYGSWQLLCHSWVDLFSR